MHKLLCVYMVVRNIFIIRYKVHWVMSYEGKRHWAGSSGLLETLKFVIFFSILIISLRNFRPQTWPARSPDLTPCDYFLWGYVKVKVFVPPQPVSVPDLKNRITAAVETIRPYLLSRVWQELDYRLDVCRVTKVAYIEHL